MQLTKLHLACGKVYAREFLNIDQHPGDLPFDLQENEIKEHLDKPKVFIMKYNLAKGIPAENNTVEYIYHSHFLEHLSQANGKNFLKECYIKLKISGKMRLAVPDFNLWCSKYINNDEEFFNWYSKNFCKSKNLTNNEIFNQMLYTGHFYMYDLETLTKILSLIGFRNIEKKLWGESENFPGLDDLEEKSSLRKPESLVIECTK